MKFQKYEKYKPSGVEWFGDIPEEWEVKRLKDNSVIFNGSTPKSNNSFFWNGDIVWITPKDISRNLLVKNSEKKITIEGYESCGTTLMPPKTIIMTTRAPIGNISITEVYSCTNQGCKSIYSKIINYKFLFFYLYAGILKIQSLGCGTTFFELPTKELNSFCLLKPNKQTQTQIANYLDKKTAFIDKKIELLEKKKEKYQELKQTLINEVVTKGLDKNVEMKKSGIEWIGKIPKHWEMVRGKNVFLENSKSKITANEGEASGKYKFFSSSNKQTKWLDYYTEEAESILFSTGGSAGIHYCKQEYSYSTDTWSAYCTNKSHLKYYYYYFESILYEIGIIGFRGSGLEHLQKDFIKLSELPCPPKQEQITIAKYLNEKTKKIDSIIKTIDKNIEAFKEFRKTLINDVVTGKVKVV